MIVDESERRAVLCIGVAGHRDGAFAELAGAVDTTRAVARAFGRTLFSNAAQIVDPRSPLEVFDALQKAIRAARGGSLILYFAGFLTDRAGELLLVVGDADATQRTGCVPWSDVEDLLVRGKVARTLLILNAERTVGEAPIAAVKLESVIVTGAIRPYDRKCGDAELVAYAEALVAALTAKATSIVGAVDDGVLDANALDRVLSRDPMIGHARLRDAKVSIAIRDLRPELPAPPPKVDIPAPEPQPKPEPEPQPKPEPKPEPEPESPELQVLAAEALPVAEPAPASPRREVAITPRRRAPLLPILLALIALAVLVWLLKR